MKIAITGSSGFVGTNFIKYFSELEITEIEQLTQKVKDIDFKKIDSVIHLSALVHQMKGAPEKNILK